MSSIPVEKLVFSRTMDFLENYITKQRNGSNNTKITYREGLKSFRSYVNNVLKIPTNRFTFDMITYDVILSYRNYLHDNMKLEESTVNNKMATLRSYMNYVSARDITLQQIAFAVSRVPLCSLPERKMPVIDNENSLKALLASPDNTNKGLRDKVILSFLYDSGVRVSELTGLKICNLSLNDRTNIGIDILHSKRDRNRSDYLGTKTSALVVQYLDVFHPSLIQTDYFIYTTVGGIKKAMTTRNVEKLVKKYADRVRTDNQLPEKVTPHGIRRTRGTDLYQEGVPIEAIARKLGHADLRTTKKHYTNQSPLQQKDLAERKNTAIPEAGNKAPIISNEEIVTWPEDEEEITKLLGF